MRFLRTNTAVRLTVGPFLDKADGITPETSITVTSCKLTLMVDNGNVPTLVLDTAPTASGGSNDMVHVTGDDSGFYDLELAAADVNYLGRAMLSINDVAVHCPVFHEFMILPAMIYDSMVLGTDRLDSNVTHIADTSQTARDIGASVLLSSGTGTGQLTLTSGVASANAVQISGDSTAADNLETSYDDTAGAVPWAGIIDQGTAQSVSASTIVLRSAAAFVDDALNGCTVVITNGTQIGERAIITDYVGSTDTASVTWPGATPSGTPTYKIYGSAAGATLAEIGTAVWATAARTVTAATNITSTGGTTVPQTGDSYARIGAAGASLSAVPWNASWDTEVQSEVQDAIEVNHLDHLLAVDYDPASKPGVATALLNELVESDGGVSRYTTNALEQAPTGGSAPTAAAIADAVWDEATSGHTTSGTFGEQVKTDIDDILADTAVIGATGAGLTSLATAASVAALNNLSSAQAQTAAAAALTAYDPPTRTEATSDKAEILTAVGDVPTVAEFEARTLVAADYVLDADVLAQVNAALDTILSVTIPVDGQRPTLRQAVYMNTQFLTERTVSGVTTTVKNPDGTTLMTLTLNSDTAPTAVTRAS